jgi:hypothetical protein
LEVPQESQNDELNSKNNEFGQISLVKQINLKNSA